MTLTITYSCGFRKWRLEHVHNSSKNRQRQFLIYKIQRILVISRGYPQSDNVFHTPLCARVLLTHFRNHRILTFDLLEGRTICLYPSKFQGAVALLPPMFRIWYIAVSVVGNLSISIISIAAGFETRSYACLQCCTRSSVESSKWRVFFWLGRYNFAGNIH